MYEIYLITNQINEMRYVGQAIQGITKRFRRHRNDAKAGSDLHLHRAMRKYGYDRFTVNLLATAKDQEDLNRLEMFWIKTLQTKTPLGYNMTDGGGGCSGSIQSEETKKKRSESLKGLHIGKFVGEKSYRFRKDLDTKILVNLYAEGKSTGQISEIVGVSNETVVSRLKSVGTVFRSNSEAQKLLCSDPRNTPSYREDIHTEDMIPLLDKGSSYQEIADILGCSKRCVILRLRKEGKRSSRIPKEFDRDAAVALYKEWGSLKGVADFFGTSKSTLDLLLTERKIPRTNRGKTLAKHPPYFCAGSGIIRISLWKTGSFERSSGVISFFAFIRYRFCTLRVKGAREALSELLAASSKSKYSLAGSREALVYREAIPGSIPCVDFTLFSICFSSSGEI